MTAARQRSMWVAGLSTVVEWYDFTLYLYFATVLSRVFFGGGEQALLVTLAGFAVSYLMRPLGALCFGHLGDRLGRRWMLLASMALMAAAMLATALLPTAATAGTTAGVLLLILRCVMAFSVGGEYTGVVAYLLESAPAQRRGLVTSLASAASEVGALLAVAISAVTVALLAPAQLDSWGWRIPFFLALPMGAVALWLRVSMEETPSFVQQREKPVVTQASTAATFKTILMGIGRVMVWSAAGYTYLVIMPTYLQSALHTGFNQALLIAVISNIGFALTIIPSGMLSDRIGRRTVMIIATVLLLILALPLLKILQAESSTLAVKAIVVLIAGGLVGMLAGPGPAMLSEMFPTRVRYTGLGLAYSLSNAIFSGCAGLIITGLIKETGNLDIPAYYVMATAVVSIFALMTLRKDDHLRSLEE